MSEARSCDEYNRTAPIAFMLASAFRDPKKPAPKFADFHPFAPKAGHSGVPIRRGSIDELKVFLPRR